MNGSIVYFPMLMILSINRVQVIFLVRTRTIEQKRNNRTQNNRTIEHRTTKQKRNKEWNKNRTENRTNNRTENETTEHGKIKNSTISYCLLFTMICCSHLLRCLQRNLMD